jgi:hypothetical protein
VSRFACMMRRCWMSTLVGMYSSREGRKEIVTDGDMTEVYKRRGGGGMKVQRSMQSQSSKRTVRHTNPHREMLVKRTLEDRWKEGM